MVKFRYFLCYGLKQDWFVCTNSGSQVRPATQGGRWLGHIPHPRPPSRHLTTICLQPNSTTSMELPEWPGKKDAGAIPPAALHGAVHWVFQLGNLMPWCEYKGHGLRLCALSENSAPRFFSIKSSHVLAWLRWSCPFACFL